MSTEIITRKALPNSECLICGENGSPIVPFEVNKHRPSLTSPISILKNEVERVNKKNFYDYTADDFMIMGANAKRVEDLYGGLWQEGEITILYASSNVGKSLFAVQMAEHIAKRGKKVYYFDYEMSEAQFFSRYGNRETAQMYRFSDNFYHPLLTHALAESKETVVGDFFRVVEEKAQEGVKIFILDNITFLLDTRQQQEIVSFIKTLKGLKEEYGLTFLIIAHTVKRKANKPLEQDDLGGSKYIMNFVDAAFAIGVTVIDSSLYYVKQTKVRSSRRIYDSEHVMLMRLVKDESQFLHFMRCGMDSERNILNSKKILSEEHMELRERAYRMYKEGLSFRDIAKRLPQKVSDKTIAKWCKELDERYGDTNPFGTLTEIGDAE